METEINTFEDISGMDLDSDGDVGRRGYVNQQRRHHRADPSLSGSGSAPVRHPTPVINQDGDVLSYSQTAEFWPGMPMMHEESDTDAFEPAEYDAATGMGLHMKSVHRTNPLAALSSSDGYATSSVPTKVTATKGGRFTAAVSRI